MKEKAKINVRWLYEGQLIDRKLNNERLSRRLCERRLTDRYPFQMLE